jgi:hypothetical protein
MDMVNPNSLSALCKIIAVVIAGSLLAHLALAHWLGYLLSLLVSGCMGIRYSHAKRVKERVLERYRVGTNHIYSDYNETDRREIARAEDDMQTVVELVLFLAIGAAITLVGAYL